MNFADCCTNELEFRICTNCKNIQYKIYKPFEKKCQRLLSTFANVCYFFIINAFSNVYYYFLPFNTSMDGVAVHTFVVPAEHSLIVIAIYDVICLVNVCSIKTRMNSLYHNLILPSETDCNFSNGTESCSCHVTNLDISSSGSRTGKRLASTSSPAGGVMSSGRPGTAIHTHGACCHDRSFTCRACKPLSINTPLTSVHAFLCRFQSS